jgi:hypothetical protein
VEVGVASSVLIRRPTPAHGHPVAPNRRVRSSPDQRGGSPLAADSIARVMSQRAPVGTYCHMIDWNTSVGLVPTRSASTWVRVAAVSALAISSAGTSPASAIAPSKRTRRSFWSGHR